MMVLARSRVAITLLLVLVTVTAAIVPVLGNPGGGGTEDKNYNLCGNTVGCHGIIGSNTSLAQVEMTADRRTVHTGEMDIRVQVSVTGAEQRTQDYIGVMLVRDIRDPRLSLPQRDGWTVLEDPQGRVPGFNLAKLRADGPSGNTSATFEWRLGAPPVPGDYWLGARMQTGLDEKDATPVSKDVLEGVWFHVVPPPVVEDTTPREGDEGIYVNTPIVLVFNKEMDRPTVEAAFNITPRVDGFFTWEGTVARFNVDGFLEEGTDYTFSVDTTATDTDGIRMLEPIEVNFTTGSGVDVYPPRVVSVVSSRAPLDAIVLITFDEPMDRSSVEVGFSITPSVPGNLSWRADTLVFLPSVTLEYDSLYVVHLPATARDLGGNVMGTEYYSSFLTVADTEPPEVLSTAPSEGATGVPLLTNLSLTFSEDVDTGTLERAISWDPAVVVDIVWDGATATLAPRHAFDPGTRYNLTVGTGLQDVRGNLLAEPFLLSFVTSGSADLTPPRLVSSSPSDGSRVTPDGVVRLTFSEAMDQVSVEASIMVSPLADYSTSWSGEVLSITFEDLEEGTVYTVNVAAAFKDLAGNAAREPSALRFVAAPAAGTGEPFFYVEDWLETWWDVALLVVVLVLAIVILAVQMHWGWKRVMLTAFAWVEERVRTAKYMGQARRLYYSINRQMPHSHAERYGSKVVWYWYPFYCLGGVALLSFVICCLTGLVLGLYYVPSTAGNPSAAYASVEGIMKNVSFGYMFRAIHHWSANIMIAAVVLHMLRVYFTGAYRNPRELNWVVGVVLLGLTLFFGYSGYLLPWNQLSYWAGTIGLEMCRAVPLMGDWFAELVFGGVVLGAETLSRMYFLHVVLLPAFTLGLMGVHLAAVYIQGIAEPH